MSVIDFKLVSHNSTAYKEFVKMRYDVLRKPLGLVYTEAQLADEYNQIGICGYIENYLVCGLLLLPEADAKIKMRQVAVADTFQGKGYGKALILFAEAYAHEQGYYYMHCHARETAVSFYQSLKYCIKGEEFLEVGIPHYYMYKNL